MIRYENYFAEKGVDVTFNALGATETLSTSYIKETQKIVDSSASLQSHHVKHSCYSNFYEFKERKKYTGFEAFNKIDKSTRATLSSLVKNPEYSFSNMVPRATDTSNYKEDFKNWALSIDKDIVLYLSGGLDSEFVATMLLDIKKEFTPVIFQWSDNTGNIQNRNDLEFAFDFCRKNSLNPIVKTVNIEELWSTSEFIDLGVKMGIVSPHVLTHIVMVDIMSRELADVKHLFGGEVRYRSNYLDDNNTPCNLVTLGKLTPAYNGGNYEFSTGTDPATNSGQIWLSYNTNGTYQILGFDGTSGFNTVLESGTWTNTPSAVVYQYRISAINFPVTAFGGFITPSSAPTSWTGINGTTTICLAGIPASGSTPLASAQFTIEVRSTNSPSTVVTTTISIQVANGI